MAVDIGKLVSEVKEVIEFEALSNKVLAVDAYNTIYQFLSIIRQPDGTPLTDSKGRVTSHLSGLFYRTINLLDYRITPVFVFDGVPPALKKHTLESRMKHRDEALQEWEKAKKEGMIEEAKMYAMASTRINKEIVDSAKELLGYMGIPYIQAPSEGEAQAAYMVKEGLLYATASQDYDSFLFGSKVVVRNLALNGKRKVRNIYININLERIILKNLLENLKLSIDQLIRLGILMGTDFNEGIEGVGPKTALKIVSEYKDLDKITRYVKEKYNSEFDVDPFEVEQIFKKPEVKEISADDFSKLIKEAKPNKEKVVKFMCDEHGFSTERIDKFADRLVGINERKGQKTL